ncbi:TetR family transcriptional regulator [Streptomyces endophyticus]|uniref:TetR family transcriptional regulator n=1 Tax=Streptomyces endophyticus TaxID=714166 RepID=A0ABU6F9Z2_9ACTN|nr:TetR family transcriptional regulator [Streptomyces endophyticus]MEB8339612.1 TetR family transcriptional regulator [Streptomyces endophyticus]
MPRRPDVRAAAQPQSAGQRARRDRILRAAADLGAQHGLDGVQMQDVAKDAGVALATLYRYFPSKTHLFTAVMGEQVDRMHDPRQRIRRADPVDAVAETLLRATRSLLRTPRLASAVMQSNYAAHSATVVEAARIEDRVRETLLDLLGLDTPTDKDERLVRLLLKCWHGVIVATLNKHTTRAEADTEIRLACQVLLAARSNAPGGTES